MPVDVGFMKTCRFVEDYVNTVPATGIWIRTLFLSGTLLERNNKSFPTAASLTRLTTLQS